MNDQVRVETVHNTPGDGPKLRIETTTKEAPPRRSVRSRPMVFTMSKATTALLAVLMALVFTLQVISLSQGADGGGRFLTIALAAGSGVLALLYFVISITDTRNQDEN
jgi:hypothetical protein